MELDFNWKYKDYEIKACPKHLVRFDNSEPNVTIDLLKWNIDDDTCFSLAYWKRGKDRFELYFVGMRAFEYIDKEDLEIVWDALEMSQEVLDTYYEMSRESYE